jgi:hypothetical protein
VGENSDNDWLIFDDGDDLHPAAMTVGGIGVLRVANVRFCERAALRDRPVLAASRLIVDGPGSTHTSHSPDRKAVVPQLAELSWSSPAHIKSGAVGAIGIDWAQLKPNVWFAKNDRAGVDVIHRAPVRRRIRTRQCRITAAPATNCTR